MATSFFPPRAFIAIHEMQKENSEKECGIVDKHLSFRPFVFLHVTFRFTPRWFYVLSNEDSQRRESQSSNSVPLSSVLPAPAP